MPGSIEKHMPGSSGCVSPSTMYGGSCVVSADAVADAVDEVLAVAGVGDHLRAARSISWQATPGPDGLEAGLLGCADDLVDLALLVGRLADVDRAGRVRAVAVLEAAEVEHDHVAVLDRPLAGLVVRVGAVRARADDGEVDLRVAVLAQQLGEIGGDLGLACGRRSGPRGSPRSVASAAAPAAASRSSSSASLIARSMGSAAVIDT